MWVQDASQSNYTRAYSCSLTIRQLMNVTLTQTITCPIKKIQCVPSHSFESDFPVEDVCALTETFVPERKEVTAQGKKIAVLSDLGLPFGTSRQNAVWVKLVHRLSSDHKFPLEHMHCPCRLFLFTKMTATYCSEVQRVADTLSPSQVHLTLHPHNPESRRCHHVGPICKSILQCEHPKD